ncbi:pyrin and HIN domain-containing protein 1-like [Cricetulus griseus]|uniref:Pyrin and HIN domain-containing protein 1-like n=1 Tax=Cricetulus griseus TaxID=10029 RepID=A0A9J7GZF4_CRIGR|nr:pyrin and HIN domain-containing protein 1-like [Cricetulus griseus]XP_035310311.1 pyrin and HIN domain-containing protein 1-like [Cricetulus griseus]
MVNEYKKIVLLSGLQSISDYHFRVLKSLLTPDLQLNKKMQDDYDRIKIADLMEEKFQSDAGLSILIELFQNIPELGDLVHTLRKQMEKVKNKNQRKVKHVSKRPKHDESCTSHLSSNTKEALKLEPTMKTPSLEKHRDTITKSPDIVTAQSLQGKHKLPELSATNRCQAVREPQTPRGLPTTASSSLQTPPEPSTSRGPSAPFSTSGQTSQVSPVTASSSIHTAQVTSTRSYSHQDPLKSPKTASSSVPALQASPATVTSNAHTLSTPQAAGYRSFQASRMTPATMTSGYKSPWVSAPTVSGSYNTPQDTPATMPSSFKSPLQSAATQPSSSSTPQWCSAKVPGSSSATLLFSAIPLKKPRLKTIPKRPSEEDGHQEGPKQVMVLKATEPFTYDMREDKTMFHATVATETEFFRVKVFDKVLKEKFIINNVIVISDYIGRNGFLEIHSASSVSEVNGKTVMNIPPSLRQRANATPKINTICTQRVGTFVNGVFAVYRKTVKNEFIYYGIEDKTGKMEVVVHGQFTNMYCEPGDKLRLFCFELSTSMDKWQLRSGRHSYLQVIQARMRDLEPPNPYSLMENPYTPI